MNILKRIIMGVGGIAMLAVLLQLSAPKALHAITTSVTATLVQVVNTAAAPAITENVPNLASQIVTLTATVSNVSGGFESGGNFYQVSPKADVSGTAFVVPQGQNLVVNAMDFDPTSTSTHTHEFDLYDESSFNVYEEWRPSDSSESEYRYPSGIVLGPGVVPFIRSNTESPFEFKVYLHGYLTAD
jgi:hypothetical protein